MMARADGQIIVPDGRDGRAGCSPTPCPGPRGARSVRLRRRGTGSGPGGSGLARRPVENDRRGDRRGETRGVRRDDTRAARWARRFARPRDRGVASQATIGCAPIEPYSGPRRQVPRGVLDVSAKSCHRPLHAFALALRPARLSLQPGRHTTRPAAGQSVQCHARAVDQKPATRWRNPRNGEGGVGLDRVRVDTTLRRVALLAGRGPSAEVGRRQMLSGGWVGRVERVSSRTYLRGSGRSA